MRGTWATTPAALQQQDDAQLINYTYFPDDGFLRDPERIGFRAGLQAPRGPFVPSANPAYTYPDLNHVYLAAVRADGTVLMPSFHRPWLFGSLDPSNPNWTSLDGKYKILRPRPGEHPPINGKPGFPFPEDATGNVKNLIGPGGNDSVWLDLNAPVLTAPDGRTYKPLFAPLVVDLDGRINVNVHGNVRGRGRAHVSNQGWGPWEVNLGQVLNANADEWKHLFVGGPWPGTKGARPLRFGSRAESRPAQHGGVRRNAAILFPGRFRRLPGQRLADEPARAADRHQCVSDVPRGL